MAALPAFPVNFSRNFFIRSHFPPSHRLRPASFAPMIAPIAPTMSHPTQTHGQMQPDAIQPGAADQNVLALPFGLAASMHAPIGQVPQQQQPPGQTNWSHPAPFDMQGASREGESAGAGQLGMTPPANPILDAAPAVPFPLNTFPGVPLGSTVAPSMFLHQAPPIPPMIATTVAPPDVWQTAYSATMSHIQQIYKDRVAELTTRNVGLENECQSLRHEIGELQRRVAQAESARQQAELDTNGRRGRFHPYIQDMRCSPASSMSSGTGPMTSTTASSSPARGMAQSHGTFPGSNRAITSRAARGHQPYANLMDPDGPGGGALRSQTEPTHEELMQTSLRARPGRPDPSIENHPHSAWYQWFRAPVAGTNPPPLPTGSTEWLPDLPLPGIALRCMGPEAEKREDERVEQARHDKAAGKLSVTPPHADYQPPDFGEWSSVAIATVNQAHNLRHCAIYGQDKYAAHLYRHLNVVFQSDPTICREEGPSYLIRSWPADAARLPFERGASNSTSRRNERKKVQRAAEREATATATLSTPIPDATAAPIRPSRPPSPMDFSSAHWVSPAIIPSEAWSVRAFSGLQRQLEVSMKATDVVKAFATIPTARWPVAMRDEHGKFPMRSDSTFCTPLKDDVFAEVFITNILPVVPSNHPEKYSESAFFRGIIELFSLRELYTWIFEHGNYDELLVEEPSPYPYDCTALGLHHIVAWAHCCGIGHHSSLRDWIHTYAFNTRHRLEGRHSGALPQSFTTFPALTRDLIKTEHIPLITPADAIFNIAKASYTAADAPSGTAAPANGDTKPAPELTEDITMAPASN